MRFAVEAWAPDYGASVGGAAADDLDPTAQVETGVEVPDGHWGPRPAVGPAVEPVVFVDGIQRIDAQVWIEDHDGTRAGLCATYAAGAVRCDGRARVEDVRIERGLFTAVGTAEPIRTAYGTYQVRASAGGVDELGIAVVERMRALEAQVARDLSGAALIVLDGLLWGRADIEGAIGYVKTHRAPYLADPLADVVARLQPGERTPLFLVSTGWTRFSWYLRLPGGKGHPWAGIVRCEASPDLTAAEAARFADAAAATLPRYASSRYRDPRAPQNLYPIGGLERELRRRAGDARLLLRGLARVAPIAG